MEMEEDMEVEQVFTAHEVDIDYEFDAARYFNFTREETPVEARRAELWFESAKSYPPSRKPLTTPFPQNFMFLELQYLLVNILVELQ